jgi:outer membrane protein assembly factor BamA
LSNTYQFNRALVDAREYISLGSNRHVVALRQVTSLEKPDAGSRVPFYLQSPLGGSSLLRGYSSFRYRDEKLLALAGEYRFELRPKIELALIYATGKVFPTMQDFDLRNLLHSYGAGIRLKTLREVRLRIDVMHSAESTRLDVKFGPSF